MNLVLFDFDGTITTKDSLPLFLKYTVTKQQYIFKMVKFLPIFILYKLKLIKNDVAKEILIASFFKGIEKSQFQQLASNFSLQVLDTILRDDIYQKFLEHIKSQDKVIVVSASIKCWIEPWIKKHNVDLLCTELLFEDNRFSGKFSTKNCYGDEKLSRVLEYIDIKQFDKIYAYGDSKGDDAILSIADFPYRVK